MAHHDLIDDKAELALLYYRSGDFEKALTQYSECIRTLSAIPPDSIKSIRVSQFGLCSNPAVGPLVHPRLGSILDQRSATFQKLNDPVRALQDAKRLVEIEPISCKGYLRVGKLMRAKKDYFKAYENFKTGIKVIEKAQRELDIRVPERLFAIMKQQHQELKTILRCERVKCSNSPDSQGQINTRSSSVKPNLVMQTNLGPSSMNSCPNPDAIKRVQSASEVISHASIALNTNTLPPKTLASRLRSVPLSRQLQTKSHLRNAPQLSTFLDMIEDPSSVLQPPPFKRFKKPSLDPFTYLSPEILELIFMLLPVKIALLCRRVSKTWQYVLDRMPKLFSEHVNFKPGVTFPEFQLGIKFIKGVVGHSFSKQVKFLKLRSTYNLAHLEKVMELLILLPGLNLLAIDAFDRHLSLQLFLGKFSKLGWRLNNFQKLEQLKLALGTCSRNENLVLEIFKRLKVLCLVSVLPTMSNKYNELLPLSDKRYKELIARPRSGVYQSLEILVYVNHPKLVGEDNIGAINAATFNPYPVFMTREFPNLKELSIASCDFSNHLPQLGSFLNKTPCLKRLVLENNKCFSMIQLFHLLKNYNPQFRLEKLVFRDKVAATQQNLYEIGNRDLQQLNGLVQLDIAGSSLSAKGLLKLLRIANKDGNLVNLNIGQSGYLVFRADNFQVGLKLISLGDILKVVPRLSSLCLNDMLLDNRTMKQFHDDIEQFGYENVCLKVLDLSFCNKIEGYGFINLFKAYPTQNKELQERNMAPRFSIDSLIIDGLDIHKSTMQLLFKHAYVRSIVNDPSKQRWRVFGVNSLMVY